MNSPIDYKTAGISTRSATQQGSGSFDSWGSNRSLGGTHRSLEAPIQSHQARQRTSVLTARPRAISQCTAMSIPAHIVTFEPQDTYQLIALLEYLGPLIPQLADNPPPLFMKRLGLTLPSRLKLHQSPMGTHPQAAQPPPAQLRVRFKITRTLTASRRLERLQSHVRILNECVGVRLQIQRVLWLFEHLTRLPFIKAALRQTPLPSGNAAILISGRLKTSRYH